MRWSQRKKPSHPVPSAVTAKSNRTAGSPNGPKGGRKMPYLTAAWSLAFALVSVERAVHHERPRREPRLLEEVLGRPVPRERDGVDPCATARRAERDDVVGHCLPHADRAGARLDEEVEDPAERLAVPEPLERVHAEADDGLVHRPDDEPRVVPVDERPLGVLERLGHRFPPRPDPPAP